MFSIFFPISANNQKFLLTFNSLFPNISHSGANISISGVATVPGDSKHIDNKIFGTNGVIRYSGRANGRQPDSGQLEIDYFDSTRPSEVYPGFAFENLDTGVGDNGGYGPESVHAFVDGCLGLPCYVGADAVVGLKAVQTIDAIYRSAKSGKAELMQ